MTLARYDGIWTYHLSHICVRSLGVLAQYRLDDELEMGLKLLGTGSRLVAEELFHEFEIALRAVVGLEHTLLIVKVFLNTDANKSCAETVLSYLNSRQLSIGQDHAEPLANDAVPDVNGGRLVDGKSC